MSKAQGLLDTALHLRNIGRRYDAAQAAIEGLNSITSKDQAQLAADLCHAAINFEVIAAFEFLGYQSHVYNAHNNTLRPLDRKNIDPFLINVVGFKENKKDFVNKALTLGVC